MQIKISGSEKAFIRAYVNYEKTVINDLSIKDSNWLEYDVTGIMNKRNTDYRNLVEDYITGLLLK